MVVVSVGAGAAGVAVVSAGAGAGGVTTVVDGAGAGVVVVVVLVLDSSFLPQATSETANSEATSRVFFIIPSLGECARAQREVPSINAKATNDDASFTPARPIDGSTARG